jgi:hypothetical protein
VVPRLVNEKQAITVVSSKDAIDQHDNWFALYKRTIVDRSQH